MREFEVQSYTIRAGSSETIYLPLYDANGIQITNLTGYVLKYSIINNDKTVIKTINGVIQTDKFLVTLSSADTRLIAEGKYFYQVDIIYPNGERKIVVGVFIVNGSVVI